MPDYRVCPRCGTITESTEGRRIGVFNYNSLVECLTSNFDAAFPNYPKGPKDPQAMIQFMGSILMKMAVGDREAFEMLEQFGVQAIEPENV